MRIFGLLFVLFSASVLAQPATPPAPRVEAVGTPSTASVAVGATPGKGGAIEQHQGVVARKNERSKGDIFVISNRNGTIKPDCSGLGDSLDSQVKYLVVRSSGKSCEIQNEQDFLANMILQIKESNRPLVIFIHGSGQGFKTAFGKADKFLSLYDTNILSLDWPIGEKTGDYKIANRKAGDSGKAFAPVFKRIMEALSSDNTINISIFSHSMGNYVLQKLVESSDKSVFSGVKRAIINAPDVMLKDHENWVGKLADDTTSRVYIFINQKDLVITCAADKGGLGLAKTIGCAIAGDNMTKGDRLGNTVPASNFANGTTYLEVGDMDNVKSKHEYYLGSPKKLGEIYREILDGSRDPTFNNIPHKKQTNNRVIRFK